MANKKMTKEEKEEWIELYEYVRKNVMDYDENQALSRSAVLRLKGLKENKYMANNNVASTSNYSFKVILNTFKYCSSNIKRAKETVNFDSESYKLNYIMKIVENSLNTVYTRMKKAEETKNKTENTKMDIAENAANSAVYINKNKNKNNDTAKNKYSNLW